MGEAPSHQSYGATSRFIMRMRNKLIYDRRLSFFRIFGIVSVLSISLLSINFLSSLFVSSPSSFKKRNIPTQIQNINSSGSQLSSLKETALSKGKSEKIKFNVFQGYHDRRATQDVMTSYTFNLGKNSLKDVLLAASQRNENYEFELHLQSSQQQRAFLEENGKECYGVESGENLVLKRYDEMDDITQDNYKQELWKFCALSINGGAYVQGNSLSFLDTFQTIASSSGSSLNNYAVLGSSFEGVIDGSFLFLCDINSQKNIAMKMVSLLLGTSGQKLDSEPLLIHNELYRLIQKDLFEDESTELQPGVHHSETNDHIWSILEQRCSVNHLKQNSNPDNLNQSKNLAFHCPDGNEYCCELVDSTSASVLLLSPHVLVPTQYLPPYESLPKPYKFRNKNQIGANPYNTIDDNENLLYISTIREKVFIPFDELMQSENLTPNLYEILSHDKCLPESTECSNCLRNKLGANCTTCAEECTCYCKKLCDVKPSPKFVSKILDIHPPLYRKDPSRIIPRIVHQTWFEPVTKDKYPNMSRLIESFKQSGWEYRFYDDDQALEFLSTHFPPEVREAYESMIPGAFKADLFRYCTLLINGGVYADMDVILESNLDAAVDKDIGFMVPIDEPGSPVNRRMCLWNGFIASAPAHPFLAKVIEYVVNHARNKFTSVDMDSILCPNPELSVSHAFDTLFTAGPCILGAAMNKVLMRHLQTPFIPGNLDSFQPQEGVIELENSLDSDESDIRHSIPGRSVILSQNKADMGCHRFTWLERNLLVAATDMPNYDDREQVDGVGQHYSKSHVRVGVYGLENLYTDDIIANEDLKFRIIDKSDGMNEIE